MLKDAQQPRKVREIVCEYNVDRIDGNSLDDIIGDLKTIQQEHIKYEKLEIDLDGDSYGYIWGTREEYNYEVAERVSQTLEHIAEEKEKVGKRQEQKEREAKRKKDAEYKEYRRLKKKFEQDN